VLTGVACAAAAGAGAAQECPHPRDKLTGRKGFEHIVVRAHHQPDDAVGLLGARCKQDDWHLALLADRAAEAEAILAGHHDVENDEFDRTAGQHLACLGGIGRLGHAKAGALKIGPERFADRRFVIDEEQMGPGRHLRGLPVQAGRSACASGRQSRPSCQRR